MKELGLTFKAAAKFLLFIILNLIIVPLQSLVIVFHRGRYAHILPRLWCSGACKIFGISFTQTGNPERKRQTIFIANHISYMDIPLIGSLIPVSFVAKSDVASWPVFGFLSKINQTAFLDRRRNVIRKEKGKLTSRIAGGRSLIIFPEGTTTSGETVLPFKSSLFSLALESNSENLLIQPVTIALQSVDGQYPTTTAQRNLYAWPREMDTDLHLHLWRFAKTAGANLNVIFHPPLPAAEFNDRKTLAKTCHEQVCKGLGILAAS